MSNDGLIMRLCVTTKDYKYIYSDSINKFMDESEICKTADYIYSMFPECVISYIPYRIITNERFDKVYCGDYNLLERDVIEEAYEYRYKVCIETEEFYNKTQIKET